MNASQVENPHRRLDLGGVASYLANGVPLGGVSIEVGVPAPRYVVGGDYTGDLAGVDPRELEDHLFDLVVSAVSQHVPAGRPLWLSLSAGYDSRGLLGVLHYLGVEDVRCFSYAYGQPRPSSDPFLAAQLARACGYHHEVIPSYDGNLLTTIETNARWGGAAANFCVESDAWVELSRRDIGDLMVGDEALGWVDWPLHTAEDVLDSVLISGPSSLRRLARYAPAAHESLSGALRPLVQGIVARINGVTEFHDAKDALYVEERLNHVLLPWRERFAGRAAERVHNPLVDDEILAFVRRLPPHHRLDKSLYRAAARRRLPALFDVPLATVGGYSPNWAREIAGHLPALERELRRPSQLDELVPPEAVLSIARAATKKASHRRTVAERAVSAGSRRLRLPAGRMYRHVRTVDETTLALRLLVLREVLAT